MLRGAMSLGSDNTSARVDYAVLLVPARSTAPSKLFGLFVFSSVHHMHSRRFDRPELVMRLGLHGELGERLVLVGVRVRLEAMELERVQTEGGASIQHPIVPAFPADVHRLIQSVLDTQRPRFTRFNVTIALTIPNPNIRSPFDALDDRAGAMQGHWIDAPIRRDAVEQRGCSGAGWHRQLLVALLRHVKFAASLSEHVEFVFGRDGWIATVDVWKHCAATFFHLIQVHEDSCKSIAASRVRVEIEVIILDLVEVIRMGVVELTGRVAHNLETVDLTGILYDARQVEGTRDHLLGHLALGIPGILAGAAVFQMRSIVGPVLGVSDGASFDGFVTRKRQRGVDQGLGLVGREHIVHLEHSGAIAETLNDDGLVLVERRQRLVADCLVVAVLDERPHELQSLRHQVHASVDPILRQELIVGLDALTILTEGLGRDHAAFRVGVLGDDDVLAHLHGEELASRGPVLIV
mmetsp:Transcript_8716/g.23530  ORF Transcript_8716/g.23530 Transcript_8716/m.23530 type:complete len:465 (-) Transcript_8716:287-1681(-)